MVSTTNAAGRLYLFLERGRKLNGDRGAREVLHELLKVPNDDHALLFRRLGVAAGLMDKAKSAVEDLGDIDHEVYLRWWPRVQDAFKELILAGSWRQFASKIDDSVLLGLEVCDERLSRARPAVAITPEELDELLAEVRQLIAGISTAAIDDEVRTFMLDHLNRVANALEEYWLSGTEEIRENVAAAVAGYRTRAYGDESTSGTVGKFWRFVGRLAMVSTLFHNSAQLPADIGGLLPAGGTSAISVASSVHDKVGRDGGLAAGYGPEHGHVGDGADPHESQR